ncbi:TPA: histidine kinase [Legionella pneumophila subsp. pneumophila]|nr:histidine kinase [Legionella pneumophila subsp. pneumophila]
MPCRKCDSATTYHLSGTYQLLTLPPRGHCYSKLLKHLTESNFDMNKRDSGIIELLFTAERAQDIGHALERCYSQAELEDSKAVLLPIDIADRNVERVLNHTHSLKKIMPSIFIKVFCLRDLCLTKKYPTISKQAHKNGLAIGCMTNAYKH